jgi:hypothetical protein
MPEQGGGRAAGGGGGFDVAQRMSAPAAQVPLARVLVAAAAIALAAASAQPLVSVRGAGPVAGTVVAGASALPGVSVAWGVAAAALLVGFLGGRALLNLTWILQVLTGSMVAGVAVWRLGRLSEALLGEWATQTGVSTTSAAVNALGPQPTSWYWVTLAAGLVLMVAGVFGGLGARRQEPGPADPAGSANPTVVRENPSPDPREAWAALNRGEDPTL